MTAIGLALFAFGALLLVAFGEPNAPDLNAGEWIAGICMLAGFIFFTAGITVWAWQVMP